MPVLARKPGALRNGAPFKDWVLPTSRDRVRRKLAGATDGDRQIVDILTSVVSDGLPAVDAACAEALGQLQRLAARPSGEERLVAMIGSGRDCQPDSRVQGVRRFRTAAKWSQ